MPRPTGAIASPRHALAGAKPHASVGTSPSQYLYLPTQLSYWDNDVDGVCVAAEEAFHDGCLDPDIFVPVEEVVTWATARGVLNGATLSGVLEMAQKCGYTVNGTTYNDGPHYAVDWTNAALLQNAIWHGPVKLGVAAAQLQNVVPDPPQNGWLATGFAQDSNEDHCVSLCGYGPFAWLAEKLGGQLPSGFDGNAIGYAMFTWSSVGMIDSASMLAITGEAWLRNPNTVLPLKAVS